MLGRIRAVVEAERAEKADGAIEAEVMGEDTVKDTELSVDGADDRDDGENTSNAIETGIVAMTLRVRTPLTSVLHCIHQLPRSQKPLQTSPNLRAVSRGET